MNSHPHFVVRRCTLFGFILGTLVACVSAPVEKKNTNPSPRTLQSSGFGQAHALAPKEMQQFGRLAGRWNCALSERRGDGSWAPRPSQIIWTWFYTLDGKAIQDIWTPQDSSGDGVIATNLRLYDVTKQQWNVAWTNTQQSTFELWTGVKQADDMVLTSIRDRRPVKIRFFNFQPRQFQWSYEAATSLASNEFTPILTMQCQKLD